MTDNYINFINERNEKEELKQEVIFGQTIGLALLIVSGIYFCNTFDLMKTKVSILMMIVGAVLFLIGLIYPYALYYPSKIIKFITNKVFTCIFIAILLIVYIVILLPISFFVKEKWKKKYGFYSWNTNDSFDFNGIGFTDKKIKYINNDNKDKTSKYKIIKQVVSYFFNTRQYILIPILFILLILGLLFFFITSSIITPMIYTLF